MLRVEFTSWWGRNIGQIWPGSEFTTKQIEVWFLRFGQESQDVLTQAALSYAAKRSPKRPDLKEFAVYVNRLRPDPPKAAENTDPMTAEQHDENWRQAARKGNTFAQEYCRKKGIEWVREFDPDKPDEIPF